MDTGNITIIEAESRYKKVDKSLIENPNIDCLTLGIYTKLIVLGKKWQLNVKGLRNHLGLSEDKVRKSLSLLEKEGYILRTPIRNDKGQLLGWNYTVYPTPINETERSQAGKKNTENRVHGKPSTRKTDQSENGGLLNNKLNKIINLIELETNKEEIDKSISKKDDFFEQCWIKYNRKGSKKKSFEQWQKLTERERELVSNHIQAYTESVSDIKYQKDFERYLRDKCFFNVVFKDGKPIFDSENKEEEKSNVFVLNGQIYR